VAFANPRLFCIALWRYKIINDKNLDDLIETEMFCNPISELCHFRKCPTCAGKIITINGFDGESECYYENWDSVKEHGRDGQDHRHTIKQKVYCSAYDLVNEFLDTVLPNYIKHKAFDAHQKNVMNELKEELTDSDMLLNIDFAENYSCKYFEEIQSLHFGGSRNQISLHTGVMYRGETLQSFCTVSGDLKHDSIAIYCHLKPILNEYGARITSLHFLSDGPSTQYHCQYMFTVIIRLIIPMFPALESLDWNFSQSGHGKSPADGVGATLKRTANKVVANNEDVANLEQFLSHVLKKIKGIRITPVLSVQDKNLEKEVRKCLKPVKDTLKVRQVRWSKSEANVLYFNTLSYFNVVCKPGECKHYHLMKITYNSASKINKPTVNHPSPKNEDDHQIMSTEESVLEVPQRKLHDWVVVRFRMEEGKGERRWLGKIERINENDTFLINFVRLQVTKLNSGFIYSYPKKRDEYAVCKSQVLYSISPPKILRRGVMKFQVQNSL